MGRFFLAIVVVLLTASASGVSTMVVGEPCTGDEQPGRDDGTCAPICVTCGCCAQAAEPVVLSVAISHHSPPGDLDTIVPRLPRTNPRDILHVPKTHAR